MTASLIKKCPHCDKKNVSPGHIMGHLGRGRKKMFKPDHLRWLSRHMSRINSNRKRGLRLTTKLPKLIQPL